MNRIGKFALLLVMGCTLIIGNVYMAFADIPEIVLDASDAINITGAFSVVEDAGSSIGDVLQVDGAENGGGPIAEPVDYAEMEFEADAGMVYYIWTRGKALSANNVTDAFWIQFDGDIGTGEMGTYGHIKGFGNWLDMFPENIYAWSSGLPQDPPQTVTFETSGMHKMRIQPRHVKHYVDQIWLSTSQEVIPDFPDAVEKPDSTTAVEYSGKLAATWGRIKGQ